MPAVGEEVWTLEDVEYALAWKELEDDRCTGCGQPRTESFDPANEDQYYIRALVCHACAERDRWQRHRADSDQDSDGFHLVPKLHRHEEEEP